MKLVTIRLLCAAATLLNFLAPAVAASERYTVLVSDLHVGAGHASDGTWRRIEDFRWQTDFDKFLSMIDTSGKSKTDLVFAGDVFELWQSPLMVCSSDISKPGCEVPDCHEADTEIGCTENEAVVRLKYVLDQHKDFVASIKAFASKGSNRVYFIPGNHDAALLFDAASKLLLDRVAHPRVFVQTKGYWLSEDGAVYSDHGHQFDTVNKFSDWPKPFVNKGGTIYLGKPWGENMVQQFYNQYEEIFPIIDNLSDEKAGVKAAIRQVGAAASTQALGKFFRFFVVQESLAQGLTGLGKTPDNANWDYAAIRQHDTKFFVDVFAQDADLVAKAVQAQQQGLLEFDPSKLSDLEIAAICGAKQTALDQTKVAPCESLNPIMGAGLESLLVSEEWLVQNYLTTVLQEVQRKGQKVASVYAFGHTHRAKVPLNVDLPSMPGGTKTVSYVNTGAFQRLANPEQINSILKAQSDPKKKLPLSLDPEDLPACYTFVSVEPYADRPTAESKKWAKNAAGKWSATPGVCL